MKMGQHDLLALKLLKRFTVTRKAYVLAVRTISPTKLLHGPRVLHTRRFAMELIQMQPTKFIVTRPTRHYYLVVLCRRLNYDRRLEHQLSGWNRAD